MRLIASAVIAIASAKLAAAHGGVQAYSIGGSWYKGFLPYNTPVGQSSIQREWDTFDPVLDLTSKAIACNANGAALAAQLTAPIAAGGSLTAYWNTWGHLVGPMATYLANCNGDCTAADVNSLSWFKIDESGLISGTVGQGYWGSGKMAADNSSWTSTIPSCIPAGNYMIRHETIALHLLPAQSYPECAQLKVTGGGSTTPGAAYLAKFPGAYSSSDPGLSVDIYSKASQTETSYVVPGPPVFKCGGTVVTTTTSKTSTTTSTTSKATTTSTTSKATTTTAKASTSSTGTTGTVAHYGQCGGSGYTGPTVCVSPYTCTVANQFYSQCL